MSTGREHTYTDPDGCTVWIRPSADLDNAAFADSGRDGDLGFRVPAHRLAEFCRALYAAAGQPYPDLPVIHDPAAVDALARDLLYAIEGTICGGQTARYQEYAATLLAAGWRKP